ncbi:MAG: hypothetical protein IT371_31605 [Deltaproteobacteria bacterium]|nr:hypothetical protein [Deltaproteobacteria bacterium]
MEIYPLVDEQTVLRVPRRTEEQLIAQWGSSGRKALATGQEVSTVTDTELHDLEAVEAFIGAFVPDTTPLPDLDLEGSFRYYSLQRRVRVSRDLRVCTARLPSRQSRNSLERFLRDVRDMVSSLGLMPDLAGKGNLVLDQAGHVKLIDINNFRRLVPDAEVERVLPRDLDDYALGRKDIRPLLPRDFVDDLGYPIADLSLAALRSLEVRALGREHREVDRDPFYAPLTNERRRIVRALLPRDAA